MDPEKPHKQLSYKVFMQFVGSDGSADGILSKECYKAWVATRKYTLRQPEESFRRVLTAHVGGLDGRRPFPENVEQNLLVLLRRRAIWECFRGTQVCIGSRGYRNEGHHEKKAKELRRARNAARQEIELERMAQLQEDQTDLVNRVKINMWQTQQQNLQSFQQIQFAQQQQHHQQQLLAPSSNQSQLLSNSPQSLAFPTLRQQQSFRLAQQQAAFLNPSVLASGNYAAMNTGMSFNPYGSYQVSSDNGVGNHMNFNVAYQPPKDPAVNANNLVVPRTWNTSSQSISAIPSYATINQGIPGSSLLQVSQVKPEVGGKSKFPSVDVTIGSLNSSTKLGIAGSNVDINISTSGSVRDEDPTSDGPKKKRRKKS